MSEQKPWLPWRAGERVSFSYEGRGGRLIGHITDRLPSGMYDVIEAEPKAGRLWRIGEESISALMPEPMLDLAMAQRIIDNPGIRLLYDENGVRFRMARRDENEVGHVDMLAERWPHAPGETVHEQTGTIYGLISAERLLFAVQMGMSQIRAALQQGGQQRVMSGETGSEFPYHQ